MLAMGRGMTKGSLCVGGTVVAVGLLVGLFGNCGRGAGDVGGAHAAVTQVTTRASDRGDASVAAPVAAGAVSEPRTPKEPQSPPAERRWRVTKDIVAVTAIRVRGVAPATPGTRLAGYLVPRGTTKRSLGADDVAALIALVRSDTGFDDSITKRCRPGTSVGFELSRKAPAGGGPEAGPATQLVLDFGCAKMTAVDTAEPADLHATYFDPSRSAFVAFVKRVLPGDSEIQKLK